jgi:hypothetical protein
MRECMACGDRTTGDLCEYHKDQKNIEQEMLDMFASSEEEAKEEE